MNKNNEETCQNENNKWFNVDPFSLLKEVAEMSNLLNLSKNEN